MRIVGTADAHDTVFKALRRQAQRESVSEFLLRDEDVVFSGAVLEGKKLIPYDFGAETPGPWEGSLSFSGVVCVPLATEDYLAFCIMTYSDGTEVHQDKSVLWFDTELQTFNGLNVKRNEDGTKVCRASASKLESGFSFHEGFVAVAAPWSQDFTLVESLTIEADCLFCQYRCTPCTCPPLLRGSKGGGWSALVSTTPSVWEGIEVAFAAMSGPATMRCEMSNVVSRVVQRSDFRSVLPTVEAFAGKRHIQKAMRAPHSRVTVVAGEELELDAEADAGTSRGVKADHGAKFSCEFCGKGFEFRCRLTRHVDGVHGERRHSCQVCGKRFSQKAHMATHMRHVHRPEHVMPTCEKCGRRYSWKANLNKHRRLCNAQTLADDTSDSKTP